MTENARGRAPLILGFLFAGAALLGMGMCTSAIQQRSPRGDVAVPDLMLLAPAPAGIVTDSLVVRFRTTAPLRLTPHGWAADDLHPHILLDGTEYMAGPGDIRTGDEAGVFSWRLPLPAPGEHTLLLTWAGMHHGTVGDTTGRTIRFISR